MTRSYPTHAGLFAVLIATAVALASPAAAQGFDADCSTGGAQDFEIGLRINSQQDFYITYTSLETSFADNAVALWNVDVDLTACQWVAHVGETPASPARDSIPANQPIVLAFYDYDRQTGKSGDLLYSYTYFLCGDSGETGNFYCPRGPLTGGYPDLLFYHETDGTMRVYPTALASNGGDDQTDSVADAFSDAGWILPYYEDRVCQYFNSANCNTTFETNVPFISPQIAPHFTVTADEDLAVPQGSSWSWRLADNVATLRFPPSRKLEIEGALVAIGLTFTSSVTNPTTGQRWGGIVTYAGTVDLDGVTVSNASTGLDLRSTGNEIAGSTITSNGTGIRTDFVTSISFDPPRGGLLLQDSRIADNAGVGLFALNADLVVNGTCVEGNGGNGISIGNATLDPFRLNTIQQNGEGSDGVGASIGASGDLYLGRSNVTGLNRVVVNEASELFLSTGGFLFAGFGSTSGQNRISDAAGDALVYAPSGANVQARYNHWGASPPPAGGFPGPGAVDSTNFLASDPTSNACNDSFASIGASTDLATQTEVASNSEGNGWTQELRAEIVRLRNQLDANPGAANAFYIVRALAAHQRIDREDLLGEHSATYAALARVRRALLDTGIPNALRRAAETALSAEAADALSREDYVTVRSLLGGFFDGVNDADVRRSLTLTRAFAVAAEGRKGDAAALVAGVAAGVASPVERRELEALAAALADGEDFAPEGAMAGAAHTAPTQAAVLTVVPNPAQREAVVHLSLDNASRVRIAVYDALGREVAVVQEGELNAGVHRLGFDPGILRAGAYVMRARVSDADGHRSLSTRLTVVD
jgi:hypothetical protein